MRECVHECMCVCVRVCSRVSMCVSTYVRARARTRVYVIKPLNSISCVKWLAISPLNRTLATGHTTHTKITDIMVTPIYNYNIQ